MYKELAEVLWEQVVMRQGIAMNAIGLFYVWAFLAVLTFGILI